MRTHNISKYHFISIFVCVLIILAGSFMVSTTAFASTENQTYHIPVIMYHSVRSKSLGTYVITPKTFEDDIIYIREHGYTPILITDILAYQKGKAALPDKPIVLTLDDGYLDNYTNVLPILKKHNTKAVISVIGWSIDDNYNKDGSKKRIHPHLCYEKIKELHDSGLVEIANHTYDLHQFGKGRLGMKRKKGESFEEYKEMLSNDLLTLQNNLKEKINITPVTVTFPFGEFNKPDTVNIIKDLGFDASFSCYEGINKINKTSCLHELCRYNRPHSADREKFFNNIFKAVNRSIEKHNS